MEPQAAWSSTSELNPQVHLSIRGGSRRRVQGVRTPPPRDDLRFSNTTGILQKKTMWFIGVEVEQETNAPPPKKYPGSAPVYDYKETELVRLLSLEITLFS